jgi:hypothetical protein
MMGRMGQLRPVTVWLVHLGRGEVDKDIKGSIDIEGDRLVFTPADGSEAQAFAFTEMRRAKRLRASPVMVIEYVREGSRRETAFYFSQPPPLKPADPTAPPLPGDLAPARRGPFDAFRRSSKRRHMRNNISYLQRSGISKKELIQAWADEVASRIGASG